VRALKNRQNKIIDDLAKAIASYEIDKVVEITKEALHTGLDPIVLIENCLSPVLKEVGDKFERGEIFLPELILVADSVKASLNILEPEILKKKDKLKYSGKIIVGTVKGDIHDIGKNIVAAMFRAAGFEVCDLGVDVSPEIFVQKTLEIKPNIVGLSALTSVSMLEQKNIIDALRTSGLRNDVKVIIGGAPTNLQWAKEIGADAYAENSVEAVKEVKKLLGMSGCGTKFHIS